MNKVDIILAIVTGEVVAWFFYGILKNFKIDMGFWVWILAVLFPVLSAAGLWLAWLLGKKFLFIFQAAKFFLIGTLASVVDLGIFNILIAVSGIATGLYLSIFKGISFLVATLSKYAGDKFWAFEKMETVGMRKEFSQFIIVTLVGLVINVGAASVVMAVFGGKFGLDAKIWANIGAISAAFGAAAWNFFGYKFIVFKK